MHIKRLLLAMFLCQLAQSAQSAQTVLLYYMIRPPYMYKTLDGRLSGLWVERTEQAFRLAGVRFEWKEVPASRLLEYIKDNRAAACTPGYYRSAERQAYALFPDVVMFRSKPHVALTRQDNQAVMNAQTADALLKNRALKLLVKASYSYGEQLDKMRANHAAPEISVNLDNVGMAKMIAAGRVDYMFISGEEGEAVLAQPEMRNAGLALARLADMKQGSPRYLLCSKKTGNDTISRLSKAMHHINN